MQPLKLMNNVQKARLLHNLLANEIPEFLGYLNELTETVLNTKAEIIANWKDQLFSVDFWFGLAEEIQGVMAKYPKDLYKSPVVFSEQLFGGYNAIFTVHALWQYVANDRHTDPQFKPAVHLLFNQ